jgi:hypothetical protein
VFLVEKMRDAALIACYPLQHSSALFTNVRGRRPAPKGPCPDQHNVILSRRALNVRQSSNFGALCRIGAGRGTKTDEPGVPNASCLP